jgi:hypothetical protein
VRRPATEQRSLRQLGQPQTARAQSRRAIPYPGAVPGDQQASTYVPVDAYRVAMKRRAVIYARISIATEESVSIARQIDSARSYAKARGWQVVGVFIDEGVSATRLKPADRPGW